MVSARSTTFLLLVFLLLPLRFSTADTQDQGENTVLVVETAESKIERSMEGDQRKRFVPGTGTGRKMMMSRGGVLISKSENVVEPENVVAKGSSSANHYFVPLNADYHDPRHHPPKNN